MAHGRMHGRRDANQQAIKEHLESHGMTVCSLASVGGGCPDLVVGYQGVNILLETKGVKKVIRTSQKDFGKAWKGQTEIVWNPQQALAAVLRHVAFIRGKVA